MVVALLMSLTVSGAVGQVVTSAKIETPAKSMAFDVVSVRENVSGVGDDVFGPTADGYRMVRKPLLLLLMTGYVPQSSDTALFTPDRVRGLPEWAEVQGDRSCRAASGRDEDSRWRSTRS